MKPVTMIQHRISGAREQVRHIRQSPTHTLKATIGRDGNREIPPVTLAPSPGLSLAEIDAKYGKL